MQIDSLRINKYINERLGLKPSTFNTLGRLVVLVGANGCGKSRVLSSVDWLLRQHQQVGYQRVQEIARKRLEQQTFVDDLLSSAADHYTVAGASEHLDVLDSILAPLSGLTLAFSANENPDLLLQEYCALSNALAFGQLDEARSHKATLSFGLPQSGKARDKELAKDPLRYISDVSIRACRDQEKDARVGYIEPDPGIQERHEDLVELLGRLCSIRLGYTPAGEVALDEIPIMQTRLSEGQSSLIRLVVLIHSGVLDDVATPLLFDEPELHLHPSALVALFDELLDRFPNSQIWIATHSLALTAHLAVAHPRSIWFGHDSSFSRAGKSPHKVVSGLLGGTNGARELADFCSDVEAHAVTSFAAECFLEPAPVPYKSRDPQIEQFQSFVTPNHTKPVRVLDFGAGEGRLLEGLRAHCEERGIRLSEEISYFAVEPDERWQSRCADRVGNEFDDGIQRVFTTAREAAQQLGKSLDFVVLSNVLHEIPVDRWLSDIFGDGLIRSLLNDGGALVIIEDTLLGRGEMPHVGGYVVLEQSAIRRLFDVADDQDEGIDEKISTAYGSRLQATAICAQRLKDITPSTIDDALETQMQRSLNAIGDLRAAARGQGPSYDAARAQAYHAQLIANICLAKRMRTEVGGGT